MHSHQLTNENVVDDICVSNQLKPLKPCQDHDSPERGGLLGSEPERSIVVKSASHETAHWRGKGHACMRVLADCSWVCSS